MHDPLLRNSEYLEVALEEQVQEWQNKLCNGLKLTSALAAEKLTRSILPGPVMRARVSIASIS
jgi:hypothetical protein